MGKKLTKQQVLERLEERNCKFPPVTLYPDSQEYVNQSSPLQFKCENGHVWTSTAERVIFLGRGCPHCKKQRQRDSKRIPWDELKSKMGQVHDYAYQYKQETYINGSKRMTAICPEHGEFSIIPNIHIKGQHKCPQCIEQQRVDQFIKKAKSRHQNIYDYSKIEKIEKFVTVICPIHGEFKQRPNDHLKGHGCKKCAHTTKVSTKQLIWLNHIEQTTGQKIQHAGNLGEYQIPGTNFTVDGFCKETNTVYEFHGDAFHGNLNRYKPDERCHPFRKDLTAKQLYEMTIEREEKLRQLGYHVVAIWESEFDRLLEAGEIVKPATPIIKENIKGQLVTKNHETPTELLVALKLHLVDDEFRGFKHQHKFQCQLCGDVFVTTLTQRKQAFKKYKSVGCPSCNKKNSREAIKEIQQELGGEAVSSNILLWRDVGMGVHIKDLTENRRTDLLQLQEFWKQKSIDLKIIFEDEWRLNRELIVSKLKHLAKKSNNIRIHGRQCEIREISPNEKSTFLKKFHIQGDDRAQVLFGAFFDDRLVAVMTFSKQRILLGQRHQEGHWELSRFATDFNFIIPGIASRLLKHFQQNYNWERIVTYADRRWSDGNLYHKLGFQLDGISQPGYFYIINGIRKHRWNYRKDKLADFLPQFDPSLTEHENMKSHGFHRVWDCGNFRFVMEKSEREKPVNT